MRHAPLKAVGLVAALALALAITANAAPAGQPTLALTCQGATLVAALHGDLRGVASVEFDFGAKRVTDRTKPFSARIAASKVANVRLIEVTYTVAHQPIGIEKPIRHCGSST